MPRRLTTSLTVLAALVIGACGYDDQHESTSAASSAGTGASAGGRGGSGDAGDSQSRGGSGGASGDSDGADETDAGVTDTHAGAGGGGASDASAGDAVYALLWIVFGDEATTTYIQLADSLDKAPSIDQAREFGGWSGMAAVGGKLLVSDGESPKLTSYSVDGRKWNEGTTLNFANTGIEYLDFGAIWLLNEKIGYVTFETTSRVVIDPSEMKILEIADDTKMELTRDGGMVLGAGYHRQARFATLDHLEIPYYYYHDFTEPGPSIIASYDPKTHKELSLTEVDCEGLEVVSHDEQGNTYYSGWYTWQVGFAYGKVKAPCIARIKSDGSLDQGWPKDFLDVTEGRPVAAWQYVKNNKAIGTVTYTDESGVDFTGEFDADADTGPRYTWFFDLASNKAHKIEGIPASGWGSYLISVDGRDLLLVPNADWTSTTAYELDLEAGAAKPAFTAAGWLYDIIRVK